MNPHEQVLCVPAEVFGPLEGYESLNRQGFNHNQSSPRLRRIREYFAQNSPMWKKRGTVEENPAFQQIIPYVVVTANRSTVFSYQRGKKGHEKRLHTKRSIGVGGHINRVDCKRTSDWGKDPFRSIVFAAATREITEELRPSRPINPAHLNVRGFLRLSQTSVEKVHVGVVFQYSAPGQAVFNPSPEIVDHRFASIRELKDSPTDFEYWSQAIIPALRNLKDFSLA